jgi:hypothetical protein
MMKNVHREFRMHTKKAFEVCYLRKKTKMNLDVGSGVRVLYVGQTFFPEKTDFTPPPNPSKSGLKLVCNVNIVYGNLTAEKNMPRNLNEIVHS